MHDLIQHADAFVVDPDQESGGLSRRSFLGKSATLGAVGLVAGWTPAFVIPVSYTHLTLPTIR
ncbi:twin-arginine translocation signal domain-containing protein, partial [Pseudomonas aeruginosa]|nr:twin-arginine translocation signal domain-containing protein [Pseudomonas aeruginosa]